jgi:hypothetical protein
MVHAAVAAVARTMMLAAYQRCPPRTPLPSPSVDYVLTVSQLGDDSVTVELEQEFNSQRWRGDFSAECECGPEMAPRRVQVPSLDRLPFPTPPPPSQTSRT